MRPAELGYWFDEMGAGLVLYARQILGVGSGGGSGAEDVVQEAFMRLAAQGTEPANVRAWLLVAVRNAALDAAKGLRRRRARDQKAGRERWFQRAQAAEPGEENVEALEVQMAMGALDVQEREVITMRMWNGATFEEIGEVIGLPLSTVYLRYRSGLEKLRARWELPCRKK
jgi:RNA polymerase sigma-70 factor, ECF subfamily